MEKSKTKRHTSRAGLCRWTLGETNWVQAFESDRMTSGSQMWLGMIPWELIHYRKRQIDERFASSTPGKTDTFFNASTSCFHRGTGPSSCFPVPFLGADERLGEE